VHVWYEVVVVQCFPCISVLCSSYAVICVEEFASQNDTMLSLVVMAFI
jgi:hypothetical protein